MKSLIVPTPLLALPLIAWATMVPVASAADEPAASPASVSNAASSSLFAAFDLERPELADVRRLVSAGDTTAAMRSWIGQLATRVKTLPRQQDHYGYWLHGPADADELLTGRLTTSRYGDPSIHYTATIGPPGTIDFFARAPEYPLTIRDISTMQWVNKYAQAYGATRDAKYLRAWVETWADFADHWPAQLAAVQKNPEIWGKGPDGQQKVIGIGWVGGTLYTGWRMGTIRAGVIGILQTAGAAGQLDEIDPEKFAKLIVRLGTAEAPQARALLKRAELGAPNQVREMAVQLFHCGQLFPEFKDAAAWRTESIPVVMFSNLPDGSDREQSLNYFNNFLDGLANQIRQGPPTPECDEAMLARIESASLARKRFPLSIAMPDGFLPATGTDPAWTHFGKTKKLAPPSRGFTSILFPYGGYAVQRDGWEPESLYLFMKTSRPNKGHWRSQDGGFQLSAYGRNLLVSPIGEVYDIRDQQGGWTPYWNSSISQNAIVVDGKAAEPRSGDFGRLDPWRWHTSPRHDFMETEIFGPYGGNAVTDVVHRRQVHFLREFGCWIVTDRVSSKTPHEFTQSWCFGPEFAADDVVIDAAEHRIATNQTNAPNLSIWQCGTPDLSHESFYGVHEGGRVLGWVGILADRQQWRYTPAVNVHTTWNGEGGSGGCDQIVVSLLRPHRGTESGVEQVVVHRDGASVGFDASLVDGRVIGYRAAVSAKVLTTQRIEAEAASLLACREADGRVNGIVLDGRRFGRQPPETPDFEFKRASVDGGTTSMTSICRPEGFWWEGDAGVVRPRYTAPSLPDGHKQP